MAAERIQKRLAQAGIGSRRQIEGWIQAGRLTVNGLVPELGHKLAAGDTVRLDGRPIRVDLKAEVPRRVLLYRKPAGQVVSRRDPQGRETVFRHLPRLKQGRWIPVGRLDVNTSGLLVLTTDGELAKRLMHPSYGIEREYAVRVFGDITPEMLARLRTGVELEDGPARFDRIERRGGEQRNQWFHVVVSEGRTRLVRRLWASQGLTVSRLIRVRYGVCVIPTGTKVGRAYELSPEEMQPLLRLVGLQRPMVQKRKRLSRRR